MCLDRSLGSFCLCFILKSARVDARVGDNRVLYGVCVRVGARAVVYCCLFVLLSTNLTWTFSTSEIKSEHTSKKTVIGLLLLHGLWWSRLHLTQPVCIWKSRNANCSNRLHRFHRLHCKTKQGRNDRTCFVPEPAMQRIDILTAITTNDRGQTIFF